MKSEVTLIVTFGFKVPLCVPAIVGYGLSGALVSKTITGGSGPKVLLITTSMPAILSPVSVTALSP